LVTYEQHKNKNSSNSCCINSSNISSRSNIRSSSALCIRLFTKDDKKDKKDGGNDNDNTVTAQVNKQKKSQSGWDDQQEQEAQNTICTHPASGASCVSENEGAVVSPVGNQTNGGNGEGDGEEGD
jgi:hypothetical protein